MSLSLAVSISTPLICLPLSLLEFATVSPACVEVYACAAFRKERGRDRTSDERVFARLRALPWRDVKSFRVLTIDSYSARLPANVNVNQGAWNAVFERKRFHVPHRRRDADGLADA